MPRRRLEISREKAREISTLLALKSTKPSDHVTAIQDEPSSTRRRQRVREYLRERLTLPGSGLRGKLALLRESASFAYCLGSSGCRVSSNECMDRGGN